MGLDLLLVDGDLPATLRLGTGAAVIAQSCAIRLQMHRGEAIWDQAAGLPFTELLAVKPFDLQRLMVLARAQLEEVQGVAAVEDMEAVQTGEAVALSCTIRAVDGSAVPVSLTLGGGMSPNLSVGAFGTSGRVA